MSPGPDPRNQQPLDENFTVLIVPDAIPIPGTSVEILQTAVAAMRTAAGEVAEGAEGIESTWQGLQPHYTAPESETLFAAMGPVAAKGEAILDDTTTVADALDTFAEAAQSARTRLRELKEEAIAFSNEMNNLEFLGEEFEYWSMDPRNYLRNRELKLQVNAEWAAFQEAERACANAISAVTGSGNNYVPVSAGEPGAGDIVYGLASGDVADVDYDFSQFSDWQRFGGDMWDHLSHSEKPWPLDWAVDAVVAQHENFGVGLLWGLGVGAVSSMGLWREGSGWATSVGEVVDNAVTHKKETFEGYGALVGLYGEDGWMNPFDADERSGETWRANAGAAWTEVAHDIVPWREWEDRPAYTVSTAAGNAALAVVSLPVRGGSILANLSRGGSGLSDIDPVNRPEVAWEPGAAARPGFSLSQTFNQIRGDFSETTGGFGAGLGDLSGMIERFSAVNPGEGGGSGRGPGAPVFASDPDLPNPGRPVSVPVAGDSSGEPDRPRRRDEDGSDGTRDLLDAPSTERWPEMEEMLDAQQRRDGEGRLAAGAGVGASGAGDSRTPDADTANGSDTIEGDGVYTTLDLDAQRIEREHERDTRSVHEEIEEFSALPAERQREWLLANQLVGANGVEAPAGPQSPGFGDRSSNGFGITASHDPNSGNGDGPPRTPRDGASGNQQSSAGQDVRGTSSAGQGRGNIWQDSLPRRSDLPEDLRSNGQEGSETRKNGDADSSESAVASSYVRTEVEQQHDGVSNASWDASSRNIPRPDVNKTPHPTTPIPYDDPRAPKRDSPFIPEGLAPNCHYEVYDRSNRRRGIFSTGPDGRVVEVRTFPGESGNRNPDLKKPFPSASYVVDSTAPGSNNKFVFQTDGESRTIRAYGELDLLEKADKKYRDGNDQAAVAGEGARYFENNKVGTGENVAPISEMYKKVAWNGGHLVGTKFGGTGHGINLVAQLKSTNQHVRGPDRPLINFRDLEIFLADKIRDNKKVEMEVECLYADGAEVPSIIRVRALIDGKPPVFSKEVDNPNGGDPIFVEREMPIIDYWNTPPVSENYPTVEFPEELSSIEHWEE
jgi:hypothetical protein